MEHFLDRGDLVRLGRIIADLKDLVVGNEDDFELVAAVDHLVEAFKVGNGWQV